MLLAGVGLGTGDDSEDKIDPTNRISRPALASLVPRRLYPLTRRLRNLKPIFGSSNCLLALSPVALYEYIYE